MDLNEFLGRQQQGQFDVNGNGEGDGDESGFNNTDSMMAEQGVQQQRQHSNSGASSMHSGLSPSEVLANTWSSDNTSPENHTTPPQEDNNSSNGSNAATGGEKQQQVKTAGKAKRRRKALSCNFCRQRKLKCDRQQPCSTCVKRDSAANCRYQDQDDKSKDQDGSVSKRETERRNRAQRLAREFVTDNSPTVDSGPRDGGDMKRRLDQMESLVMTILANNDGKDLDVNNAGVGGGLDRDRVSQLVQFRKGDDVEQLGESLGLLKLDKQGKSIYHGETHWTTMFSDVHDVHDFFAKLKDTYNSLNPDNPETPAYCGKADRQLGPSQNKSMGPFQSSFPQQPSSERLLSVIPDRDVCDTLVQRYFNTFQIMFPVVHKPSFDEWYDAFWKDPGAAQLLSLSLLVGMLALGLLSYLPPSMPAQFRGKLVETINSWLHTMEVCGSIGDITVRPSILHIRVMLLWLFVQSGTIYAKEWLGTAWISLGTITRMVQSMGMHRDSKWFNISPFEAEERRRLFALVTYLDSWLSLSEGLPPAMRQQDSDAAVPANCNMSEMRDSSPQPPSSMAMNVRTESSYLICLNTIAKLAGEIVEINSVVNESRAEKMSYTKILEFDAKVRAVWDGYPPYFKKRCDYLSPGESDDLAIHRYMLELEYNKTLLALHRPFLSAATKNSRYVKSREVAVLSAKEILDRTCWLFQSPDAAAVRAKYWWTISIIAFQHFAHASIFLAVYLMNNYDAVPAKERQELYQTLDDSLPVMSFAHFSPTHDSSQSLLLHVLVNQMKEVGNMTPTQRAAKTATRYKNRPHKGITMEMFEHDKAKLCNELDKDNESPQNSSSSNDPSPNNTGSVASTGSGSINTPGPLTDQSQNDPVIMDGEATGLTPLTNGTFDTPTDSSWNSSMNLPSTGFTPGPSNEVFDSALFKSMSQAVGSDDWDILMQSLDQSEYPELLAQYPNSMT